MRVIIAGGTGLIGQALTRYLLSSGYEVVVLSRTSARARALPPAAQVVRWDGRTAEGWGGLLDGADAIVNLAGASIGIPPLPWTSGRKRRIRESRLDAGRAVVEAVRAAARRPRVVVQSSAVGYYGPCGDEPVTEDAPPGTDFLARVCVDWESSTAEVEALGVRRVIIRTGVVLSSNGGLLPLMALPFRFFVGGTLGSGRQWMPWIHIADHVAAIRFLMEHEATRGPWNLTAPNPVTNTEFSRTLGRVLRRPSFMRVPALPLRLLLGEIADLLLLGGQRAVPARLQHESFSLTYSNIESALRELLR
mgnify:CR=1 FL=1